MIDELLINIDPPIEFNGQRTDHVLLKEPTGSQLEKAGKGKLSADMTLSEIATFQMELIMAVSGLPKQIVGQMKFSDIKRGFEFIMGFIESSVVQTP
jgi:Phage tail assembly chaperone proteins, E, or 41 or 14